MNDRTSLTAVTPPEPDSGIESVLREELDQALRAVAQYDQSALTGIMQRVLEQHSGLEAVTRFFAPMFHLVGERWASLDWTVGQEHMFSCCAQATLARAWMNQPTEHDAPAIILAAPNFERHTLGLHCVAVVLAHFRARVLFLGATTPADSICAAFDACRASGVALSLSTCSPSWEIDCFLEDLSATVAPHQIAIGGQGATPIQQPCERLERFIHIEPWLFALR